jgi:hypothetical protein
MEDYSNLIQHIELRRRVPAFPAKAREGRPQMFR